MANTYKNTMNLPATDFPMRGNLPENEPKRLEKWEQEKIYWRVLEKNADGEPFILHDGPPYANGPIHIGHAFNKILKDFVNKSHALRCFLLNSVYRFDAACQKPDLALDSSFRNTGNDLRLFHGIIVVLQDIS